MTELTEQIVLNFNKFPSIGAENWEYAFACAQVRALEIGMLTRPMLLDMINAENFQTAVDILSSTEYAFGPAKEFDELEPILQTKRTEIRKLFKELIVEQPIVELISAREDFANLRLALRRKLTDKPIGTDYNNDGSIPAERFEQTFEEEDYSTLPLYLRQAIENAVLAYYQNKDVRQIDYAIDKLQAQHNLDLAIQLNSTFLLELCRMQIDLNNIRTMLRLKFRESDQRDLFIEGGYISTVTLRHGLDIGYEAIVPLFFSTPYYEIMEIGVTYLTSNKSFLKLEQHCEDHLMEFLKTTSQITAGHQPVVAYLLRKENEIRKIRLILTAKKNNLDARLILDRLGD
ncbi:MAG: V-type ATPase subunit [Planctomycetes bacterium]|nr:V-type ATPase subunit [Planctomycetota bacterium]